MVFATGMHSLEEAGWGLLLIAATMALHGLGVRAALKVGLSMRRRLAPDRVLARLIVTTWILVVFHFLEVVVIWAVFLYWKEAFATMRDCVYYALMQYTTVGSDLGLPNHLRLLGGMIAMSGLLTVAWTTAVMLAAAQDYQSRVLGGTAHGEHDPPPDGR
jgi:hypothetical protein